jgi:DNA-binding response OmpR family regulator/anti-sigma regulatory factor (Ser/Thr protein kinase)
MSMFESRAPGARVLIAEDSATQAQRLTHILEQSGYRVSAAANGKLALDLARQQKPALVISDVIMPEMDGYQLCSAIKTDPKLADVPVILVTTLSDPQDVIRGLECRADNFILKPYDADHLLRRVQFVLVNSEMHQQEQPGMGLEIVFAGQKHFITADRLQILNLLLSTYEAAIQRNKELSSTRDTLHETNKELQQLTLELEDRVRARTRELEQTNEALRQAQHALIQQERLRALGQMASGIAHDINNAISPIALYTEAMLEREKGLSDKARGYLTTIQRAIDDVAQTVGRMREFYRPREQELQLADVELNPLVQQVIDLTRARWNDLAQQRGIMIELKPEMDTDLVTIRGAENEMRDALTNLIFNAVDALPQGGTITVRTRNATLRGGDHEPCVHLEVVDTGIGMDEETRRRCLEPFFTTKGDRGTGLGLAMVYGMAKRHSAGLDIESAVGRGTTIRLTFRAGTARVAATGRNPAPLHVTRKLRVLLVDDDPSLLESLRSSLEDEGHKVTTASGGQAGIDAFRDAQKAGKPFDIVITDLGMPYVDGRQVVASVRAMSPDTPIVLLTGWGQHVANESERPPQVDRLLGKPPRIRELRAALAELTGRRATDRLG